MVGFVRANERQAVVGVARDFVVKYTAPNPEHQAGSFGNSPVPSGTGQAPVQEGSSTEPVATNN